MQQTYDRAAEDLGNSVHLEHVNVQIPDQRIAGLFYVVGLGLTRDPYLNVADNNMWINVGRSQFHLPTGNPQVLRGHTGIVMEGREALLARLAGVRKKLDGTRFDFSRAQRPRRRRPAPGATASAATSRTPSRFGRMALGFPYVEFDVPVGTAKGIVAVLSRDDRHAGGGRERRRHRRARQGRQGPACPVPRDRQPLPDFDEHHIQIYVADFSGPHRRLKERGLVNREDNQYQYRFRDIVDLDSGKHLFTIEHEVRASPIRCSCARWSTAIRRRPAAIMRWATTIRRGRWSRRISTTSSSGRCSARRAPALHFS